MSSSRIQQIAREMFGYDALRPGQREAIESVLQGNDTLVVMSTTRTVSARAVTISTRTIRAWGR